MSEPEADRWTSDAYADPVQRRAALPLFELEDTWWHRMDRQLRALANRRAALDIEEAHWLVEARRVRLHERLGVASFTLYVERVLGYGPRLAKERIRVAQTLAASPTTRGLFAAGRLSYSVVRELCRVIIPETEHEWALRVAGCTVQEARDHLAGRRRGDRPDDPRPAIATSRVIRLRLSARTHVRYLEARARLEAAAGRPLADDEVIAAMCETVSSQPEVAPRVEGAVPAGARDRPDDTPGGSYEGVRAPRQVPSTRSKTTRPPAGRQSGAGARVRRESG